MKFLFLVVAMLALQSSILLAQDADRSYPRGLNFDRYGYVSALNDRFFSLYNSLFDTIEATSQELNPEDRREFEKQLRDINHVYSLRSWKLQPQADLAWYEAMRSLHRVLGQKVRGQGAHVERVRKVDLDPALWSVCPAALSAVAN